MKDAPRPQSALGYLAAFTLGIICMGAIFFFTRAPGSAGTGALDQPQPDSSPRIHFQRTNSATADLRESLQLPRATARPMTPVLRRPSNDSATATNEFAEPELPLPEEPMPPQTEVAFAPAAVAVPVPVAAVRDAAPNGARVSGRALLMFKPPAERPLPLDARCAAEFRAAGLPPTTRHFVVGRDKGLANVLVMVTRGLPNQPWPVPQRPAVLRLRGCLYENPVLGVQAGQRLLVSNFDKILHNIHNIPERNREKSIAMVPRVRDVEFVFDEPEYFMRFKCDVHPWEFAYVTVPEHPFFAVTDANGNFAIEGLPPGRYTVEAHHRKAGVLRREISVEEFRNASADFQFRQPPGDAENI